MRWWGQRSVLCDWGSLVVRVCMVRHSCGAVVVFTWHMNDQRLHNLSEFIELHFLVCIHIHPSNYRNNFILRDLLVTILPQKGHHTGIAYSTRVTLGCSGCNRAESIGWRPIVPGDQVPFHSFNLLVIVKFLLDQKCKFSFNRTTEHLC